MSAGPRGPVPKRSDQRRRRNKSEDGDITRLPTASEAPQSLGADPEWHRIARDWFESLSESGQAQFYEPSDWATARYIGEAMSRNLEGSRFSAQLFASVLAGMTELLTTEGSRRRARIELERVSSEEEAPKVAIMDRYRRAAGDA